MEMNEPIDVYCSNVKMNKNYNPEGEEWLEFLLSEEKNVTINGLVGPIWCVKSTTVTHFDEKNESKMN